MRIYKLGCVAILLFIAGTIYGPSLSRTVVKAQDPATCKSGQQEFNAVTNEIKTCGPDNVWTGWTHAAVILSGTTGTITGTLLAIGACDTGTATVTGATTSMVAKTQASDGTGLLGLGFTVDAVVTSANTVTVYECADIAGTPPSKTFNIRVFP